MFTQAFKDLSLRKYIEESLVDPWIGTDLEGYVFLSPLKKGILGEKIVSHLLTSMGMDVKNAGHLLLGHDRIIDGIKTEIKFSVAIRDKKGGVQKDKFILNHVSKDKDWDRLIFLGVNQNPEENRFIFFTKNDFIREVDLENSPFKVQQSGNNRQNDDYFVKSKHMNQFLMSEWIHDISKWNVTPQ